MEAVQRHKDFSYSDRKSFTRIVFPTKPDEFDNKENIPLEREREECDDKLSRLKKGVLMSFYNHNKDNYEDNVLCIDEEEFKMSWYAFEDSSHKHQQGYVKVEEIKEIRCEFSKECLVSDVPDIGIPRYTLRIIYGDSFELNTLTCYAHEKDVTDSVIDAIIHLKHKEQKVPQVKLIKRWLRREWRLLAKNDTGRASLKQFRIFLRRANVKLQNKKIYDIFESVSNEKDSIDFDQFFETYKKLLYHPEIAKKYLSLICEDGSNVDGKVETKKVITDIAFQQFLIKEQNDLRGHNISYVHDIMRAIKFPNKNEIAPVSIEIYEFFNHMFDARNSVFKHEYRTVYQDMTKPISHYWIAASHNTYLSGDQLQSNPSIDTYARVLRKGCRCIELNCWDGPDNEPMVHHGLNLSNGIRLVDVIITIAENAFTFSDYPLVLSIQNHCNVKQQIQMAEILIKHLGKNLVTDFLKPKETKLPSPESLKNKIIIHHRRFYMEHQKKDENSSKCSSGVNDPIFLQSNKPGIMYMTTQNKTKWSKHAVKFFDNSVHLSDDPDEYIFKRYSHEYKLPSTDRYINVDKSMLHLTQTWYHKSIDRPRAERLLVDHNRGDGSFLVRPSNSFENGYSLSFWWKNHVKHIHIKQKLMEKDGTIRYYVDKQRFNSLYTFIEHYQHNSLKTDKFQLTLHEPIGELETHLDEEWYYEYLSNNEVEDALQNISLDGYFLVRKRITSYSYEPESYILSFNCSDELKHCRIVKDDNVYTVGSNVFSTLIELVDYYKKHPIRNKTRLLHPCTRNIMNQPIQNRVRRKIVVCRAKYAYNSHKEDELVFKRRDLITNVTRYHGSWWIGDVNGLVRKWFPVHFTEVDSMQEEDLENDYSSLPQREGETDESEYARDDTVAIKLDECNPKFVSSLVDRPFNFRWSDSRKDNIAYQFEIKKCVTCSDDKPFEDRSSDVQGSNYIAKELNDLLAYCKSTPFTEKSYKDPKHCEMSSFSELEMEKLVCRSLYDKRLLKYHERQLSRVYPKSNRFDSSNFNPIPFWNFGTQICALNYQTPDQNMQIERGLFADNGGCGYVLQPKILRDSKFNPFSNDIFPNVEPLNISLRILAARHLPKHGKCIVCPYIEIQVIGLECDHQTLRTSTVMENGLSPIWYREEYDLDVSCPPLAKIHFIVKHEDEFGDGCVIAQSCFPLTSLRNGHRSVPLKNIFDEDLPLAAIFVEIQAQNAVEAQDKRMRELPEREFKDTEYRSLYQSRLLQQEEERRRRQATSPGRRRNNNGGR